jgi:chromate transporter
VDAHPHGSQPQAASLPVRPPADSAVLGQPVGLWPLFVLFLRAGMIFGGGLTIMAVLLKELVERRHAISRSHFLTLYGLARLMPSGTMTALAVALGHLFGGFPGTVVALAGVALPALVPTLALTVLYDSVRGSSWLDLLPVTLLPAAVALLAGAVLTLGREVARPSLDLAIAVAALVGALVLRFNPGLLLILGGVLGALLLRDQEAA